MTGYGFSFVFSRSYNKGKTAPRRQIPALTGYGFSFVFSRSYTKEKQHLVKLRILRNAPRKESTARHGRKSQLSVRESLSARAHLQESLHQSHGGCRNHSSAHEVAGTTRNNRGLRGTGCGISYRQLHRKGTKIRRRSPRSIAIM